MDKKKNKKKKNIFIDVLLILVILGSLVYCFQKQIRNFYMGYLTNTYQLNEVSKEDMENNKAKETTYDFNAVTEYKTIRDFDVSTLPAIGGIAIPELNVNLLIFNGLDNYSLSYGAGTMSPEQKMGTGNYSLVSHRVFGDYGWGSDLLFSPLANAQQGMKVYITDKQYVYEYVITESFIVSPYDTYVLDQPKENQLPELTLITCADSNAVNRVIVKAKLNSVRNWDNSFSTEYYGFNHKYNI